MGLTKHKNSTGSQGILQKPYKAPTHFSLKIAKPELEVKNCWKSANSKHFLCLKIDNTENLAQTQWISQTRWTQKLKVSKLLNLNPNNSEPDPPLLNNMSTNYKAIFVWGHFGQSWIDRLFHVRLTYFW